VDFLLTLEYRNNIVSWVQYRDMYRIVTWVYRYTPNCYSIYLSLLKQLLMLYTIKTSTYIFFHKPYSQVSIYHVLYCMLSCFYLFNWHNEWLNHRLTGISFHQLSTAVISSPKHLSYLILTSVLFSALVKMTCTVWCEIDLRRKIDPSVSKYVLWCI